MAKITPVLWKHKKNKKGLSPIYLRIADTNKSRYVSLGVRIRESQWNERTGRVRKSNDQSEEINNLIIQRIADTESEILRLKTEKKSVTADHLKANLATEDGANSKLDFFVYANSVQEELEARSQLYLHKRYKSVLKRFREFAGPTLLFSDIDPELLRKYQTHLIEEHNNKPGTVKSHFNCIRAIYNRAIKEKLVLQEKSPFFQFSVKGGHSEREKLSYNELQAIEGLELDEGSLIWHVRNYFLFSFYCAGIRFGDLAKMRVKHVRDGRLNYTMSKTGKTKSIKLLPQTIEILQHYTGDDPEAYLFPILEGYELSTARKLLNAISSQNALVNKYLKQLAEKAQITCKLSFHIARHSFADIARKKGLDVYTISKALGHSSLKVTERYLKGFDTNALDEKMENLFNT